nr:phosphatidate cytidylyltransferase [Lachnospiraceae bacterium]
MLTRVISGIFIVIILAITMFSGGWILFGVTLLVSLIGFNELIKATHVRPDEKKMCGVEMVGYAGIAAYYIVISQATDKVFFLFPIILTIMGMLLVYVLTFPKYKADKLMAAAFSFIYAPVLLSYIYQTRMMENGIYIVWLVFIASWVCDTFAYFSGVLLGKHKLAPVLSPKKSVEGSVGGVLGAALAGFLYALVLQKIQTIIIPDNALWAFPMIAAVGSVLSQIGDLAASGIKRDYGIKDYGNLIPGHGGIVDRFDSVIVTAPLIYYGAMLLMH